MNGPSKHLTWKELECKDGTPYPDKWRTNRAIELAEIFELIRAHFGNKPIEVLSGYRTVSHNISIGGARFSQHLNGRALDLAPPDGVSIDDFYHGIRQLAASLNIHGIGRYTTFVHIDTRPTDRLALWSGTGAKDSNA